MLILKCRGNYTTLLDGHRIVFRKLAPGYGGVLMKRFLEHLGIPTHETGDYVLRCTYYDQTLEVLRQIGELDLRRLTDDALLSLALERLSYHGVEVEKI